MSLEIYREESDRTRDGAVHERIARLDREREFNFGIFISAGFSTEHSRWLKLLNAHDTGLIREVLKPETATFLASALPSEFLRDEYLTSPETFQLNNVAESQARIFFAINKMLKRYPKPEIIARMAVDISKFATEWSRIEDATRECHEDLASAIKVMTLPEVYKLFGNSPERLVLHMKKKFSNGWAGSFFNEAVDRAADRETTQILRDLDLGFEEILYVKFSVLKNLLKDRQLLDIVREYSNSNQSWGDRIVALDKCFNLMGRGDVGFEEVRWLLLNNLARQHALQILASNHPEKTFEDLNGVKTWLDKMLVAESGVGQITQEFERATQASLAALEALPSGQKYSVLCGISQSFGYGGTRSAIENILTDASLFEVASKSKINRLERDVDLATSQESQFYPLNSMGVLVRNGFEVELDSSKDSLTTRYPTAVETVLPIMAALGFKLGRDLFEVSPGPFRHPDTAIAIFDLALDAGIVDYLQSVGHTYHFNIELSRHSPVLQIVWGIVLAGQANDAKFSRMYSKNSITRLVINSKEGTDGPYIEGKVFSVITPEGFRWTHGSATKLAIALNAHDMITKIHGQELTTKTILECKIPQVFRDLALAYHRYKTGLEDACRTVGLGGLIDSVTIHGSRLKFIHNQISLVYPDVASRYDPINPKPKASLVSWTDLSEDIITAMIKPIPVRIGKVKTYPTIVHFAKEHIDQSVNEIDKILNDLNQAIVRKIRSIENSQMPLKRQRLLTNLLKYTNTPLPKNPSQEDMEYAYAQMKACYKL